MILAASYGDNLPQQRMKGCVNSKIPVDVES